MSALTLVMAFLIPPAAPVTTTVLFSFAVAASIMGQEVCPTLTARMTKGRRPNWQKSHLRVDIAGGRQVRRNWEGYEIGKFAGLIFFALIAKRAAVHARI
jgi:hypothetical protein